MYRGLQLLWYTLRSDYFILKCTFNGHSQLSEMKLYALDPHHRELQVNNIGLKLSVMRTYSTNFHVSVSHVTFARE